MYCCIEEAFSDYNMHRNYCRYEVLRSRDTAPDKQRLERGQSCVPSKGSDFCFYRQRVSRIHTNKAIPRLWGSTPQGLFSVNIYSLHYECSIAHKFQHQLIASTTSCVRLSPERQQQIHKTSYRQFVHGA